MFTMYAIKLLHYNQYMADSPELQTNTVAADYELGSHPIDDYTNSHFK